MTVFVLITTFWAAFGMAGTVGLMLTSDGEEARARTLGMTFTLDVDTYCWPTRKLDSPTKRTTLGIFRSHTTDF